jgi:hypothetical protein
MLFAVVFGLMEVVGVLILWVSLTSPHIVSLTVEMVLAMMVQCLFGIKLMKQSNIWRRREDSFFDATGAEAPHSYNDVEAMKAISEQLAGLFLPVEEAMIEIASLRRQRLTDSSLERCAELEEQIRKGREHYAKCREVALPFLTLPFRLPSERKLSEALNERLRRSPIPFRPLR